MTGVCPAQSPRTHRRIGSARGFLSLAPGRMLPPLNSTTTGTFPIPWGTGVKLVSLMVTSVFVEISVAHLWWSLSANLSLWRNLGGFPGAWFPW